MGHSLLMNLSDVPFEKVNDFNMGFDQQKNSQSCPGEYLWKNKISYTIVHWPTLHRLRVFQE